MAVLFPMFLKLEGRKCVVVGAGRIATQKLKNLMDCAAEVNIIAPVASPEIQELARNRSVTWTQTEFKPAHLAGSFLVIAATGNPAVNEQVYRAALKRGVLCNSVDEPERCDFYYPALVRRGDLQIAISTAGKSPALARRIREELEVQFDSGYIAWLKWLGIVRELFLTRGVEPALREQTLKHISSREIFKRFTASNERKIRT
jgi:precorrin-2 dehydrogenase/sirohydrochlorin ferrochelatase